MTGRGVFIYASSSADPRHDRRGQASIPGVTAIVAVKLAKVVIAEPKAQRLSVVLASDRANRDGTRLASTKLYCPPSTGRR